MIDAPPPLYIRLIRIIIAALALIFVIVLVISAIVLFVLAEVGRRLPSITTTTPEDQILEKTKTAVVILFLIFVIVFLVSDMVLLALFALWRQFARTSSKTPQVKVQTGTEIELDSQASIVVPLDEVQTKPETDCDPDCTCKPDYDRSIQCTCFCFCGCSCDIHPYHGCSDAAPDSEANTPSTCERSDSQSDVWLFGLERDDKPTSDDETESVHEYDAESRFYLPSGLLSSTELETDDKPTSNDKPKPVREYDADDEARSKSSAIPRSCSPAMMRAHLNTTFNRGARRRFKVPDG
ncbi:hypothetical protein MMC27_007618 [Xylographa pallens]|nr:hypothetical protein [Xylographa pallens]